MVSGREPAPNDIGTPCGPDEVEHASENAETNHCKEGVDLWGWVSELGCCVLNKRRRTAVGTCLSVWRVACCFVIVFVFGLIGFGLAVYVVNFDSR